MYIDKLSRLHPAVECGRNGRKICPTGSHCSICIKVTAPVDTNVSADYRQLYTQVMTLIYQGERYRLNDKDRVVLHQYDQKFGQISPLEEIYRCCLSFAEKKDVGRTNYADGNIQPDAEKYILYIDYQYITYISPYYSQAVCSLKTGQEGDSVSCCLIEINYFSSGGGGRITATAVVAATVCYRLIIRGLGR